MTDYSQFEAGLKSGIQADPVRIRKKDELIKPILRGARIFLLAGLIFFVSAASVFIHWMETGGSYKHLIGSVVLVLCSFFCFWRFVGRQKMAGSRLREFYEEGLLTGGLIINTEPLTLMVLSSLVAYDGGPDRYGCYKLVMKQLEGAKGELYEKIPCSCFFRYESGNYHDAFQPHPLYWGTTDLSAIARALDMVEQESLEDNLDTWGIIRRVAEEFPGLKDGQLVILDENYEPMGIRYYWQTGMDPVNSKKEKTDLTKADHLHQENDRKKKEYHKKPQEAMLDMKEDKPGRDVYERFVSLALKHKVYDYISRHCKNGSIENCSHPGFFTCIGDPVKFPQELRERNFVLQTEEYPLFMGRYLATTRGFYRKKEFIPWRESAITVKTSFVDAVKVYVNGQFCTEFEPNVKGYENWEQIPDEDKQTIAKLEAARVEEFLQAVREMGMHGF